MHIRKHDVINQIVAKEDDMEPELPSCTAAGNSPVKKEKKKQQNIYFNERFGSLNILEVKTILFCNYHTLFQPIILVQKNWRKLKITITWVVITHK